MNQLYPLKFKPVFKEKIWGGIRIKTKLGMDFSPLLNCGEAWVLSGVEGNQTIVADGFLADNELNELIEVYMDDLVGTKVFQTFGEEFPILVKFIDANDYLSIQVHPDDELAGIRHNGRGKTEMWYILDAEDNAELISGFNKDIDRDIYVKHLNTGELKSIMNVQKVKKGDVFYIPAGRVHALGPGILLAEIQQTSDITYRIYDWDRVDENGKGRELHTQLALDALDFDKCINPKTDYKPAANQPVTLVDSPYFITRYLSITERVEKDISMLDSFIIYVCTEGSASIKYHDGIVSITKGEVVLIPAELEGVSFIPLIPTHLLEVYMQ